MDIKYLKTQYTKILNASCKTLEEFEEIQEKLNELEMEKKCNE